MAKKEELAAKEPTSTYKARSTIKHDGKFYYVGDTMELTERSAAALRLVDAISAVEKEPATGEQATGDKDPE